MIQSWHDDLARQILLGASPKGTPGAILKSARRRLQQLDAATAIEDMRTPPGNRLHALTGDRGGQWSVSVNDQYRICFIWGPNGPERVEIVDYH
ncbi:type II toxin-antitoxin system RelE/ParE family toxin [soil metagenome]